MLQISVLSIPYLLPRTYRQYRQYRQIRTILSELTITTRETGWFTCQTLNQGVKKSSSSPSSSIGSIAGRRIVRRELEFTEDATPWFSNVIFLKLPA